MKTTDLMASIAQADPAAHAPGLSEQRGQLMVDSIIMQEATDTAARPSQAPFARTQKTGGVLATRKLRVGLAAAAVAAALIAVPSLTQLGNHDLPGMSVQPASAAAVAFLNQSAQLSITAKDPKIRPDQYWQITTSGSDMSWGDTQDGSKVTHDRFTSTEFVAADASRPTWTVAGSPQQIAKGERLNVSVRPLDTAGFWSAPTPHFLAQLPRDTQALRDRLYKDAGDAGPSPDAQVMDLVAQGLRSGLLPADLRCALYQVMATINGVQVTKDKVLVDGVVGTSIGRYEPNGGELQEIVISPQTGEFLGERSTLTDKHGQLTQDYATYTTVQRRVVNTIAQSVLDSPHTVVTKIGGMQRDEYGQNHAIPDTTQLVTCAPGATKLDGTCAAG